MENVRKVITQEVKCAGLGDSDLKSLNLYNYDLKTQIFLNLENRIWSCAYRLMMRVKI